MFRKEATLSNETGLHARPASMLVREAAKYGCDIKIIKGEKQYNAKSIMSIMSMGAIKGDALIIQTEGPDAERAALELADFIENKIRD
jgi:phosphocarrier protein